MDHVEQLLPEAKFPPSYLSLPGYCQTVPRAGDGGCSASNKLVRTLPICQHLVNSSHSERFVKMPCCRRETGHGACCSSSSASWLWRMLYHEVGLQLRKHGYRGIRHMCLTHVCPRLLQAICHSRIMRNWKPLFPYDDMRPSMQLLVLFLLPHTHDDSTVHLESRFDTVLNNRRWTRNLRLSRCRTPALRGGRVS